MSKSLDQFLFGSKTVQRGANMLINAYSKLTWNPGRVTVTLINGNLHDLTPAKTSDAHG